MKVVFDTNIFVSALAFPGGQADKALLRVIEGRDQLLVSKPIIKELLDVLSTKFAQDREELASMETLETVPLSKMLGKASTRIVAFCPVLIFLTTDS